MRMEIEEEDNQNQKQMKMEVEERNIQILQMIQGEEIRQTEVELVAEVEEETVDHQTPWWTQLDARKATRDLWDWNLQNRLWIICIYGR